MATNPNDIKGELCIFVKVHPKPGTGPQLIEYINKFKEVVKNEPGTLEYSWAQNGEEEVVLWERYKDVGAFTTHTTSEVFKAFVAADLLKEAPLMTFYSGEVTGGF